MENSTLGIEKTLWKKAALQKPANNIENSILGVNSRLRKLFTFKMFLFKIAPSEICLPARQLAAHQGDDCCDVVSLMAQRRHLCDGPDRRRDSYGRGGYGGPTIASYLGIPTQSCFSINSEEIKKHQAAEFHSFFYK